MSGWDPSDGKSTYKYNNWVFLLTSLSHKTWDHIYYIAVKPIRIYLLLIFKKKVCSLIYDLHTFNIFFLLQIRALKIIDIMEYDYIKIV